MSRPIPEIEVDIALTKLVRDTLTKVPGHEESYAKSKMIVNSRYVELKRELLNANSNT